MASSSWSSRDHISTISDPDSMSSSELFALSLNKLSKGLPQSTSSRATMSIYLRWLEVHRREPTRRTEHWQNTLLHWAQSLRSRGFRESEIIAAVDDWKEANGPFRSQYRRYPPMETDIGKAFEEMKRGVMDRMERGVDRDFAERMDRLGDSYRPPGFIYRPEDSPSRSRPDCNRPKTKKRHPDNFDGPPPPNYVCNRCGKKGHHLQVCPTNLDPAYDRPPDSNYECEICKARGKHFKSLCPKNTDPYSIYQKRKAKGITTPPSNKGRVFCEWQKEIEEKKEEAARRERRFQDGQLTRISSNTSIGSSSPTPSLKNERSEKLQEIEDLKSRLFKEDYYDIDEIMGLCQEQGRDDNSRKRSRHDQSGSSSSGASPAPSMLEDRRKKARTTSTDELTCSPRAKLEMADTSVDTSHFNHESLVKRERDTEMDDAIMSNDGSKTDHVHQEYTKSLYSTKYLFRTGKINTESMSIDESDTSTSDQIEVEAARPPKQYSNFVQKLIRRRPEMNEVVNTIKRRPTAVYMWKQDDRQRLDQMNANMPEASPPYSPFESEEAESSPQLRTPEPCIKLEYAQLDGAGDEKLVDENKVSPRTSGIVGENRPSPQRKISSMGKEAIGRLKELTTNVAQDLQTFKLRGGSPYRTARSRTEELSPGKQRKQITGSKNIKRIDSKDSFSSLQVNAASSALNLTEENIKGLAQGNSRIVSRGSESSFGSLEVNLPMNSRATKSARKQPNSNPFAVYAGRLSLGVTKNDTDDSEATLQEERAETQREEPTSPDATDLQS